MLVTKCKTPTWNAYILYNSNCMTFWKRQNHWDSKSTSGCQGLSGSEGWTGRGQRVFRAGTLLCVKLSYSSIHDLGASQGVLVVKNPPANAGDMRDMGLIPGLGRSPGGEHGNPLQYSCLENPMDRGAWLATVHWVAKSQTWLKWLRIHIILSDQVEGNLR